MAVLPDSRASKADLRIAFPSSDRIRLFSKTLFSDPHGAAGRHFFERAFLADEVLDVGIEGRRGQAEISFHVNGTGGREIARKISKFLTQKDVPTPLVFPSILPESGEKSVRLYRHGHVLSTWRVKHETPRRIRFHNPALHRKRDICLAIERELMSVPGIDTYQTSDLTATVLVTYDAKKILKHQIVEVLDAALHEAATAEVTPVDLDFPVCTASLGVAAATQFLAPVALPVSAALFVYSVVPSFQSAHQVLFKEKRLGVDVLDSIVVMVCLATGQIFAGSVLAWCLSFGRKLLKKTEDDSKKMLLNVFGKQPRFVWLLRDGVEVETPLEKLKMNDVIVVNTG